MRKAINGKIVTIDNVEIFQQAEKALLLNRVCTTNLSDPFILLNESQADKLKDLVSVYEALYTALPYPLYALDMPIKYATLGLLAKQIIDDIEIYVEDCSLDVVIDTGSDVAVQFINKSYKVIPFSTKEKKSLTDLSSYQNTKYYIYFDYCLNKFISPESESNVDFTDFYSLISSNILSACSDKKDIAAQLENILRVKSVPKRGYFKTNVILDTSNKREYILNFIKDGVSENDEPSGMKCISLVTGKVTNAVSKDVTQLWKLDCYVRENDDSKLKNSNRAGFYTLFYMLCSMREANKLDYFPDFKAIIVDGKLIVELDNIVYVAPSDKLGNLVPIAEGAELYSIDKNNIYLESADRTGKIKEKSIYCYNTRKGSLELCQTKYDI